MQLERKNDFPQVTQVKGVTPVCVISCLLRLLESVNEFPQTSQVKGFTPVCVIACFLRLQEQVKYFPHTSHVKGITPVCLMYFETAASQTCFTSVARKHGVLSRFFFYKFTSESAN